MSDLSDKMRGLAASGHPRAAELVEKADEFDAGIDGFYADPQTITAPQHLGRWARARKLWSECSGEPL